VKYRWHKKTEISHTTSRAIMEQIGWMEHRTKEEVSNLVGEERFLIATIQVRLRNWIGRVLNTIVEGRLEGRRAQ
jgi:hypothetical protein